jgi:apolipoprotein N-acyltransferase
VRERLDEGERGYLVAEVELRTGRTPSTLIGPLPEIAAAVASVFSLVIVAYLSRRRRFPKNATAAG